MTILSLSKQQMVRIEEEAAGDTNMRLVQIIRRGLVKPRPASDDELRAEFGHRPQVVADIATAIIENSWPNIEI